LTDVREPEEIISSGRIPGAINIPITSAVQSFHIGADDFIDLYGFEKPEPSTPLIMYCKAGIRARSAAGLAQHAGFENVSEYPGSWLDWMEKHGEVEKRHGSGAEMKWTREKPKAAEEEKKVSLDEDVLRQGRKGE
jgi:3-mercaptopyruvate sulfurtransferase SseA